SGPIQIKLDLVAFLEVEFGTQLRWDRDLPPRCSRYLIAGHRRSPYILVLCVGIYTACSEWARGAVYNFPITSCLNPYTSRLPAKPTSCPSRVGPGSKRTAVPAAMSRRWPRALARSNFRAG